MKKHSDVYWLSAASAAGGNPHLRFILSRESTVFAAYLNNLPSNIDPRFKFIAIMSYLCCIVCHWSTLKWPVDVCCEVSVWVRQDRFCKL